MKASAALAIAIIALILVIVPFRFMPSRDIVREEITRQLSEIDELTVSKLVIADESGTTKAEFGGGPDGSYLSMYNKDGIETVYLVALVSGAISVHIPDGGYGTLIGDVSSGNVELWLVDKDLKLTVIAP